MFGYFLIQTPISDKQMFLISPWVSLQMEMIQFAQEYNFILRPGQLIDPATGSPNRSSKNSPRWI
jgi:hypothetical protein